MFPVHLLYLTVTYTLSLNQREVNFHFTNDFQRTPTANQGFGLAVTTLIEY